VDDSAAALAGLDALDTPPWCRFRGGAGAAGGLPPLVAVLLFLALWQALWASAIVSEVKIPAPVTVWDSFAQILASGEVWSVLWTSISEPSSVSWWPCPGHPLGLLVARCGWCARRRPLLQACRACRRWLGAGRVLWFGLTDATIYFVVLLGSVPSIAMAGGRHRPRSADLAQGRPGTRCRDDQRPAHPAAGRTARFLAGCKQAGRSPGGP